MVGRRKPVKSVRSPGVKTDALNVTKSRGQRKRMEKKQRLVRRRALGIKKKDEKDAPFRFKSIKDELGNVDSGAMAEEVEKKEKARQWHSSGSQRGLRKTLMEEKLQIMSVLNHQVFKQEPIASIQAHLSFTQGKS
ncbi:hypothetical protein NDN08_005027 [Rhodosorus marinus]|uniref:Ribosome biogenesis protein SLX9 n=1 Tax=Rhodosorus marinus TaxID=101924 RepID=A0AAV8V0E0_9RHOD|nr:hypothetical protein NDN08_005027 [Rhodosorus marinus]